MSFANIQKMDLLYPSVSNIGNICNSFAIDPYINCKYQDQDQGQNQGQNQNQDQCQQSNIDCLEPNINCIKSEFNFIDTNSSSIPNPYIFDESRPIYEIINNFRKFIADHLFWADIYGIPFGQKINLFVEYCKCINCGSIECPNFNIGIRTLIENNKGIDASTKNILFDHLLKHHLMYSMAEVTFNSIANSTMDKDKIFFSLCGMLQNGLVDPNFVTLRGNIYHIIAKLYNNRYYDHFTDDKKSTLESLSILGCNIFIQNKDGKIPIDLITMNNNLSHIYSCIMIKHCKNKYFPKNVIDVEPIVDEKIYKKYVIEPSYIIYKSQLIAFSSIICTLSAIYLLGYTDK